MGMRNYLIEGVSGTGKTSVCKELQRRGYYATNGDTELAYQGDPETGKPRDGSAHEHHIWHVDKVKALVASQDEAVAFFCGGLGIFQNSQIYLMACLSLKSTLATASVSLVVDEIARQSEANE
jgi:predicted ATPase